MPRSRAFMQVDVFSTTPCLGNPVAVVLDGTDVTDQEMQRLARWTNLSETTFILPPTAPEADYRLRIFAPGGELPFAGHPTLGSARAWLDNGGTPQHPGRIVQQCAAGLVSVRHGEGILSFAAPPLVRDGPLGEQFVGQITAAFGINRDRVLAHQWVDNGPGWAVVQLPTAEEVLALEPDLSLIPTAMVGAIGAYPDGSGHAFEMRTFAPRVGVAEDPACGSMNASVGQWLTATGAAPSTYRVSQGTRMGRAGTIEITADADGTVWVGGAATAYIRGTITLLHARCRAPRSTAAPEDSRPKPAPHMQGPSRSPPDADRIRGRQQRRDPSVSGCRMSQPSRRSTPSLGQPSNRSSSSERIAPDAIMSSAPSRIRRISHGAW